MKRHLSKRRVAVTTAFASALIATAAFAFFSTTGDGTGTAGSGHSSHLTVVQVGAGYSSLVTTGGDQNTAYTQDQCFNCAQVTELGNNVTLANVGYQRLVSVTVAFRNWGDAIGSLPITLNVGGNSDTETVGVPAAQLNGRPTTFNVTFNFSLHPYIPQQVIYDISFNNVTAPSLNVALSSSANGLTVGSDTTPGTVLINTTAGAGLAGDMPACSTPANGVFAPVVTNCGPASTENPGAYGLDAQVAAGNADIPAIQINVVGGVAAPLYPGGASQPVDYAITNPSGGPVHVGTITTTIGNPTVTNNGACNTANTGYWYRLQGGTPSGNAQSTADVRNFTIPPGTTYIVPSGISIYLWESGTSQDACQNALVNLVFSTN